MLLILIQTTFFVVTSNTGRRDQRQMSLSE
nr:MAG TPA: hypothetical protein [Caudoviricetes sp.]